MAHRPLPDLPAVRLVLERLKDLNLQLEEEGVPFGPEASVHLTALTAAVSGLEANRRFAYKQLEVETTENSKLKRRIKNTTDRMKEGMMAAARSSDAGEIEQLRGDLSRVSRLLEGREEKLQTLVFQNTKLQTELLQMEAEHQAVSADLHHQIRLKSNQQLQLDQKLQLIEEITSSIADVQQENTSLQQTVVSERRACSEEKLSLSRETEEVEERIKTQREATEKTRGELDGAKERREESLRCLGELYSQLDAKERHLQSVAASRSQMEQQLEEGATRSRDLCQRVETLEKESHGLKVTAKNLQEEITTLERRIEEEQASCLLLGEKLSQAREVLQCRRDEENRVRAEHLYVSQQLKRSKLQLEERNASVVVHRSRIKEMEQEIRELQRAELLTRRELERSHEELHGDLETMKEEIRQCEEDKRSFTQLLEELKRRQEEHVEKMTSNIVRAKRRYEELLREEAALLQLQPKSADTDLLESYMTQTETEYKQMQNVLLREVQAIDAEIRTIGRSTEEKQRVLEEKEEVREDLEAKWKEMRNEHDRLAGELNLEQTRLKLSIQNTENRTELLLQPKQELKARLEELQEAHQDLVKNQTSELLTTELSLYNDGVMLRQVRAENHRMDLRIRQKTEELRANQQEEHQFLQEEQELQQQTKDTMESLQEAWRQDVELIQRYQSRGEEVLDSMTSLVNRLNVREEQLLQVLSLLHQSMLDFSRRLGDTATSRQQS